MGKVTTKQRKALRFVTNVQNNGVLYAVILEPERVVAPQELAHLVLISGASARRFKMRKNTITWHHEQRVVGKGMTPSRKRDKGKEAPDIVRMVKTEKIDSVTPNFRDVSGEELKEMWAKCNPKFKEIFKSQTPA